MPLWDLSLGVWLGLWAPSQYAKVSGGVFVVVSFKFYPEAHVGTDTQMLRKV